MIAKDLDGNDVHVHVCKSRSCLHEEGHDGMWYRAPKRDNKGAEHGVAWLDGYGGSGPKSTIFTKHDVRQATAFEFLKVTSDGRLGHVVNEYGITDEHVGELFAAFVEELPPYAHACSDGCKGLVLVEETGCVECCEDCARFEHDLEAIAYVQGCLRLKKNGTWE